MVLLDDKVVAVIEQKKLSPKPIADPVAFLFGCLKKMEINPSGMEESGRPDVGGRRTSAQS